MKITTKQHTKKTTAAGLGGALGRAVVLLLGAVVLFAVLVLLVRPAFVQEAARQLETRWGYAFRAADSGLAEKWSIAVGVYLREALDGVPAVPSLVLDVPFKEIRKIYAKREEALARGILIQGTDDFVKGEIRLATRIVPIKLRLKGDWNDHLAGRKWSFRLRVRDGDQLFGMRRFSLQNPNTRGFQAELMYFSVLSKFGIMAPRYSFADVTLNGDSMGLMAVEEFFAKELLEFNRRREGVIVRFDESLAWSARDGISGEQVGWGGAFDSYRNAAVDGIGSSAITADPALLRQYQVAEGLLRGFAERRLTASEVFDAAQLGAFLAVSDYFGSWHAVAWHNLRFYLNPVSLKLEPIGFDATLQDHFDDARSIMNDEPIVADMLRDDAVWQRYAEVIEQLRVATEEGSLQAELREVENAYLPILQTEFRMLGQYPLTYLQERVAALAATARQVAEQGGDQHLYFFDAREAEQYPVLAHFGLLSTGSKQLRIENAIPKVVQVVSAEWVTADGRRLAAVAEPVWPVQVPPRGIGAAPERIVLQLLEPPAGAAAQLEVRAGLQGRQWSSIYTATTIFPALETLPVPQHDMARLRALEFLQLDPENKSVTIMPGSWRVDRTLVLPPRWSLNVTAGTQLSFAVDASLIVTGTVSMRGTSNAPVQLSGLGDATWPGLVVMNAPSESSLEHVIVSNTSSVVMPTWVLTGGVNFYYSDVRITNTEFRNSYGEDALNIIHSRFQLRDSGVSGTASDAFDADFSTGSVIGGVFADIGRAGGGDAIDVSGSDIDIAGTEFRDVSDKALSVGENSRMRAKSVTITRVGTGAAAKDGSQLELSDSSINGASFVALTAYIKKPEYGAAAIVANRVAISATETALLVQSGSEITLDGAVSATRDVNVDALYDTVMKPGLR